MRGEERLDELLEELADDREFQRAMLEEDLITRVAYRAFLMRRAIGLTQEELAERMGTKQPAIARLEAGDSNIRLRTLARLAFSLKCDAGDLVSPTEPRFLENPWRTEGGGKVLSSFAPSDDESDSAAVSLRDQAVEAA